MIFPVFLYRRPAETHAHNQKNNTRYFQPQLMQHPSKGPTRGRHGARGRPRRPAALNLLRGHAFGNLRHHP